jgi:hypothetical protein
MPIVGYSEFLGAIKIKKPAEQLTLKPILEKIKNSSGAGNAAESDAPAPPKAKAPKSPKAMPVLKKKVVEIEEDKDDSPPPNSFAKAAAEKKKPDLEKSIKTAPKASKAAIVDGDGLIITPLSKNKRSLADSRTKYPLNEVKGDAIEVLREQCNKAFGEKFTITMFAKKEDFEKHIKCVQ